MPKFDAVVVGAGNGGLSAAITLAKAGRRTLLIEQHNLPGGVATSFRRGRFEFEPSLHELCDLGSAEDPGEVRGLLCGEYGLDIPWLEVPDTFRVLTTDSAGSPLDATMPAGRRPFIEKLVSYVPDSRKSVETFFELMDETLAAIAYISGANGKTDSGYMQEHFPNFLRTGAYPVNKVLAAIKMPLRAQDIINTYWSYLGMHCDNMPFVHYAAMVHKYIHKSAYIPQKTSHQISTAMIERFRALGGEVWFNCRATGFEFDGDHISGIRTTQGDIDTRYVVMNGYPTTTYANMMPAEKVPERELKLANARKYSGRMFVTYVGLDKTAEELGIKDYSLFLPATADTVKEYESLKRIETNNYNIALCYNLVNPDISPKGTCMMSFTTMYMSDCWGAVDPKDYVRTKNMVAERMIDWYEKKSGITIKPYIEEFAVASPWTFCRYTGSPEGSVYGYEASGWDGMMARLMMLNEDYPIKGLKFCGAAGPRGDGYSASYICGNLMGKLTLKQMAEEGK